MKKIVSQHAMEPMIISWPVLITFKHLQNIHPHIQHWHIDTVHAEIWIE